MPRINLARPRRRAVPTPALVMPLAVLLCVAAPLQLFHDHLGREARARHRTNLEQRATLAAVNHELAPLRTARDERRRLLAAHAALGALHRDSRVRARVLRDLGGLHEDGVRYTALRFAGHRLRLQGVAASARELDALLARLGAAPWFREPVLQTPDKNSNRKDGARSFVLGLRYQAAHGEAAP